jgi:hypothetical protein
MSRIPPKMEQLAAIKANVYHVLPIVEDGITYSIDEVRTEKPKASEYFLLAMDAQMNMKWKTSVYRFIYNEILETDVQDIFVVDLYVDGKYLTVKLEYQGTFYFDKTTGIKQDKII